MKATIHCSSAILMILLFGPACSDDLQQNEVKTSKVSASEEGEDEDSDSTAKAQQESRVPRQEAGTTDDAVPTETGSTATTGAETGSTGNGGTSGSSGDSGNGMGQSEAEKKQQAVFYFNQSVAPLLESLCIGCHVGPREPAQIRATEGIYVVENMLPKMMAGTSSVDNSLIRRVKNVDGTHPGGDRCNGDYSNSPCKEIVEFGKIYYGDSGEPAPEFGFLDVGLANSVTDSPGNWSGTIIGWAFDKSVPAESVMVEIYLGDAAAGGTLLGTLLANQSGSTFEKQVPSGNHKFLFTIPPAMITSGVPMNIFAYAMINGAREEIGNFTETFYVPQNLNFYEDNIAGLFGGCAGCHSAGRTALGVFSGMAKPKPSKGTTATTNEFYLRISNTAPFNHSGGNVCGGGLCDRLVEWWNLEFGNQ